MARTLRSISENGFPEVILVADTTGNLDHARRVADHWQLELHEVPPDEHGKGYAQREHGIRLATGTHLAFMDDDDIYTVGVYDAMLDRATDVPVIFRMQHPAGLIWRTPRLEYANVGTPMFLVPNRPEKLGRWVPHTDGHAGDFTFIHETVQHMGGLLWDDRVVCQVRPT